MWYRKVLGVSATLALVLAACASPSPGETPAGTPTGEPTPGLAVDQVFKMPASEPPTLDPTIASDSASLHVIESVHRPLLWFTPELEATTEGGLAEDFVVADDGLSVTFTLKDGIAYSDGTPIVAEDFVFSWKRLVDPRTAAPYSYVMGDLVGGPELLAMAEEDPLPSDEEIDAALDTLGVSAPDDSTFVVELNRAAAYFPFIATLWVTVPLQEASVENEVFTSADSYVSTGPFMVTEWSHDELVVLEPNPEWVGTAPTLTSIEYHITEDPEVNYQAFLAGEVDMTSVPSAHLEEVRGDAELSQQFLTGDVLCTYYLGFDMDPDNDTSPVENKALRHAISRAIDRQTLIDVVRNGIGKPADSFIPVGMPGHEDYGSGLVFDVDQAQADLDTALDELGLADASEISLTLGFNTGSGHEEIMEFVQAQLQDNLGITVTLSGQEWGTYLQTLAENPDDFYRLGWCQDFPHPHNFLFDVWSCGTGNNRSGYCNAAYDELLAEAAVTPTLDGQLPLYEEAQAILTEEAPAVWVYWYGRATLVKPYVQGLTATAGDSNTGSLFYDRVSILEHEV